MRRDVLRTLKTMTAILLAVTILAGAYITLLPVPAYAAGFSDTTSHWGRVAIDKWVEMGILNGVSADRFEPDRAISRAEFLAIINRTFGATEAADISRFRDVPASSWYYNDIAKAFKMGTTTGTSQTEMSPDAKITRQDAVTLLARALGISNDSGMPLLGYRDADKIASYARPYVSAFVSYGYLNGFDGSLNPLGQLSRAEAVTILDNLFSEIVSGSVQVSSEGSVLINTAGTTISGAVYGDLVIADGVGTGDVTLSSCTVTGRLVIRGGGINSVTLSDSTIQGGVFAQNPNGDTRLVMSDSTTGEITAMTGLILEGEGTASVSIPAGVTGVPQFTLSGVALDSFSSLSPVGVALNSGSVGSFNMQWGSNGSMLNFASGSHVAELNIAAQNVSVTGTGSLSNLDVSASGANISMTPQTFNIDDNLSAIIGGMTHYGKTKSTGGSNVSRSSSAMNISQNSSQTGGSGLSFSTASRQDENQVTVSQSGSNKIPLSTRSGRLAYWIGFFIPAPTDSTGTATVTYYFDGASTDYSISQTTKNGVRGIELLVPVTRDGTGTNLGALDSEVFIKWNSGHYETMSFTSGTLNLTALSSSEEATLVGYFTNSIFYAYNGSTYSGAEAIRRLLASDNALGLDTRGFTSLSTADMTTVASSLYGEASALTTRTAIQERLLLAMSGNGVLFAINRAMTAEQIKSIIELKSFGTQIGIDETELSKYFTMSQAGRLSVARTVLLSRGTDYADEEALKKVFIDAVNVVRDNEAKLLASINAAKTSDEMQKILETKANAQLIDIVTDADPYKSLDAAQKTSVANQIIAGKTYSSLDDINSKFISIVGLPGSTPNPGTTEKVMSVGATQTKYTLIPGDTAKIEPKVTLSSSVDTSTSSVEFTPVKPEVATVDASGNITAVSKGSATITITSKTDPTKKTTVSVSVVDQVLATAISFKTTKADITVGGMYNLTATLTPASSTSKIIWSSDDPNVATVSGTSTTGTIRGVASGATTIYAMVEGSSLFAEFSVLVYDTNPNAAITPSAVTVGIGLSKQLTTIISPVTRPNKSVSWKSDNPSVATVDINGNVTGVSDGTATITATTVSEPKVSADCTVTVDASINSLKLDKDAIDMYIGIGTVNVTATKTPSGSPDTIKWDYDSKYATLTENSNGNVTLAGVAQGTFTLTAYLADDMSATASCTVTVLSDTITSVSAEQTSFTLVTGDTAEIKPIVTTSSGSIPSGSSVAFSSNKTNIAIVDGVGEIRAISKGSATITITSKADSTKKTNITVNVVDPVDATGIAIKTEKAELARNGKFNITATLTPSNSNSKIIWSCDDETIAKVSGTGTAGVIEGVAPGITKISAMVENTSISAYCTVIVYDTTQGVMVYPDEITVGVETSGQLTAVVSPVSRANKSVYWTSSDTTVAKVDPTGKVTGVKAGTATIKAMSQDNPNQFAECEVTVDDTIRGVKLSTSAMTLYKNGSASIIATPIPDDGAEIDWSYDTRYASLQKLPGGKAMLTGINAGTFTLTAYLADNMTAAATCEVTVLSTTVSARLSTTATGASVSSLPMTLGGDDKYLYVVFTPNTIENKAVDWSSDKEDVVTVNENGRLTAVGEGTAVITAVPQANQSNPLKCTVTVTKIGVTSISLVPNQIQLEMGNYRDLTVTLLPEKASIKDVRWDSSNPNVVEVSESGRITVRGTTYVNHPTDKVEIGKDPGTGDPIYGPVRINEPVTITATSLDNTKLSATCVVTVPDDTYKNVTKVEIDLEQWVFPYGQTSAPIQLIFNDGDTYSELSPSDKTITWTVGDNGAFAQIDQNGSVTGVKPGMTTITATTGNGKSDTKKIIIADTGISSVVLKDNGKDLEYDLTYPKLLRMDLAENNKKTVTATPVNQNAYDLRLLWKSSAENVVKVNVSTGELTAVGTGTATITIQPFEPARWGSIEPNDPSVILNATTQNPRSSPVHSGITKANDTTYYGWNDTKKDDTTKLDLTKPIPLVVQNEITDGSGTFTVIVTAAAVGSQGIAGISGGISGITPVAPGSPVTPAEPDDPAAPVTPVVPPKPEPTAIKLRTVMSVAPDKIATLVPYLTPYNADTSGLRWSSSDESVATVENGTVRAVNPGTAKITVTNATGTLSASCSVTVKAEVRPVTAIVISRKTLTLNAGTASTLSVTYRPTNATIKGVTWESSDETVARVEPTGKVIAVSGGTAKITAMSDSGAHVASCTVTVRVPLKAVKIPTNKITLKVGETYQIPATLDPVDATGVKLTFSSRSSAIAAVSSSGLVTARRAGTTTITVKAGTRSAVLTVTVVK